MEDGFDDNQSVGSLGTMSVGSLGASPHEEAKSSGSRKSTDEEQESPEARLVKQRSRNVHFTKMLMLVLLLTGGIVLAAASFVVIANTADEDSECYDESDDENNKSQATLVSSLIGATFFVYVIVFLRYDYLVTRRQSLVMDMANRSRHIVDSLFPSTVRDRLLHDASSRRLSGTNSNNGSENDLDVSQQTKKNTAQNQGYISESAPIPVKMVRRGSNRFRNPLAHNEALPPQQAPTNNNHINPGGSYLQSHNSFANLNYRGSGGSSALDNSRHDSHTSDPTPSNLNFNQSMSNFGGHAGHGQPLADLFPNTTVLFADIAGFTAWSSEREPSQVFTLLETVYSEFDKIASRLKVFKVETIGDSYMAVTGLPEPNEGHAVAMARFAYQSLRAMDRVTKDLEAVLGPGTNDLNIRVGMHSGPVTAGVLRGQKSRFQLFGDTVNTASRMESTGTIGRIQVSGETADLLIAAGKVHWLKHREDKIVAKGKGELATYWLEPHKNVNTPQTSESDDHEEPSDDDDDDDDQGDTYSAASGEAIYAMAANAAAANAAARMKGGTSSAAKDDNDIESVPKDLVVKQEALGSMGASRRSLMMTASSEESLQQVKRPVGRRQRSKRFSVAKTLSSRSSSMNSKHLPEDRRRRLINWNTDVLLQRLGTVMANRRSAAGSRSVKKVDHAAESSPEGHMPPPLGMVADVIILPAYEGSRRVDATSPSALATLREDVHRFVSEIADLYEDVPFHNFEHASHVTLAASKLLKRICEKEGMDEYDLHMLTYGISSDPLTQFGLVFAALIHDVGHTGIPNAQLVKEGTEMASQYKNQSVAEQHSVDVAWRLLLEPRYERLRSNIYKTNVERKRFRQVLINAVMATDISDRDLNQMRKAKWTKAFRQDGRRQSLSKDEVNRRATVILEHVIQVADVAHTMQHWHIYRRWNERLFHEMSLAFSMERAERDPAEAWYKGELGFFDHYVIPLAEKMNQCGIFGASGDQYIAYAQANRDEWARNGEKAVTVMVENLRQFEMEDDKSVDSIMGESTERHMVEEEDTKSITFV